MTILVGLEPTGLESNTITTSAGPSEKCLCRHGFGKWKYTVRTGWTTKNWGLWVVTPKLMNPSTAVTSNGLTATYKTRSGDQLLICVLGQSGQVSLVNASRKVWVTGSGVGRTA